MNNKDIYLLQQNHKIGIVIPIYNTAKYLRKCLDSVISQTYGNFYAVLVNDGSTDILEGESISQSLKIAMEYVTRDSRFVLIDKKNGGHSSARNVGISYFKGGYNLSFAKDNRIAEFIANDKDSANPPQIDYIIFLDSDDFWEVNLLEKCTDSALKCKAEIVWFSWNTFYDDIKSPNKYEQFSWLNCYGYKQEDIISNIDWLNRAKENKIKQFSCCWDKLISFEHLNKIKLEFLNGIVHQDMLFAELLFAQSKRIVILPEMLVNYRVHQNNTSNLSAVKQKILPPFVKSLEKYFSNSNEAWAYFRAFSWCAMASEFVKFCDSYGDKVICEKLKECFLGHLLGESCAIVNFKDDPYQCKVYFLASVKRFGKKYLPRDKRQFAYYKVPILWQIYNIYPLLKSAERKFRHWRRSKKWF